MNKQIYIFGHKNPDTDSVTSAIALGYLKKALGDNAKAYILDDTNKETDFVLNYFKIKKPDRLNNVRIQIKDLKYDKSKALNKNQSILDAYNFMNDNKIRTLPIVGDNNILIGIITMKDIAMSLIQKDQRKLDANLDNIIKGLHGDNICSFKKDIKGSVYVTAFHLDTIEEKELFKNDSVVIVGDRYEIIKYAIEKRVKLIIITGKCDIPKDLLTYAMELEVNIIQTEYDTYQTSKIIYLTNDILSIMKSDNILLFNEDEYLDECKDVIQESQHSKFPVVNSNHQYLGILGRGHIINPSKKKIILVDHNEYTQSVEGLNQGEILEVIDHHKIGDISTTIPIHFRNSPVGSTNTIVYQLYKEHNIQIPFEMAGLMLSGIISDTLLLKSPTTTSQDIYSVNELLKIINIDLNKFAMEMFKNGTDIKGKNIYEVFYSDYKELSLEGVKLSISQVFTLDFDVIHSKLDDYLNLIEKVNNDKGHYITLLLVTDIVKQGSYILYNENRDRVIESAFGRKVFQGIFIEECVSRKKQVIPMLSQGISNFNKTSL